MRSRGNQVAADQHKHIFCGLTMLFLSVKWNGHSKDCKHDLRRISIPCVLVELISYLTGLRTNSPIPAAAHSEAQASL